MSNIPLRNRIRAVVGVVFRRPMIKAKDRFLAVAHASCRETQRATLQRLLTLNSESRFSQKYGLAPQTSVEDFRQRLPVSDYEAFRPYIDALRRGDHQALLGTSNRLLMFAVSSGTTAKAKLVPITDQFVRDYRRGWQHWGIAAQQDHPSMRHLKMVQISSRHDQTRAEDGTPCGSISGLVTSMQRRIVRKLYAVPGAVAEIDDGHAKRHAIARFAFADPFIGMLVTANPSTLLQLIRDVCPEAVIRDIHDGTLTVAGIAATTSTRLQRYLSADPGRARDLERIVSKTGRLDPAESWPHMHCLGVWSGGSVGTYTKPLLDVFGPVSLRDHGLHASEGRMTIPFQDGTPAGLLDIESHFFEFIHVNDKDAADPNVLLAHELEVGQDYFILLTTSSGLYRYDIHDVVRCTGFHGTTPLLEFRHKGAQISSITGEKISEAQVIESVAAACQAEGVSLMHFTLTPEWGEPPRYVLFVGADGTADITAVARKLAERCDVELRQQNCEYAEKRGSQRLGQIRCQVVEDDGWKQFRSVRLARSGGTPEQYKHPCLLPDPEFEKTFLLDSGRNATDLARVEVRRGS